MTIDADVVMTAKHWGLDPRLLQAVVIAEGDILQAVRCSLPKTQTRQDALDVTARSCVHAMRDFITSYNFGPTFVEYWGHRWAPPNVANDPRGLNANWVKNVATLWLGKSA
jgi:hypothetical protein